MELLKCSVCGGELLREGGERRCKYCGTKWLVSDPNMENEMQTANTFRDCTRFEEAAALYRQIIKKYKGQDLSDAYWGLLLCEQRVMFETDEKGERFPSFYAITDDDVEDSPCYQSALSAAQKKDPAKAEIFRDLAKKMAHVKQLYSRISESSKGYDIFICFKKTADDNSVTKDTALAADIYNHFAKDYNVFFSERTLRGAVVRDFEPNIYYALYSAKVMLLLCSKKEYIESKWVKNEWSRFLQFSQNPAAEKVIIPIFLDEFKPNQLPSSLLSMQGLKDDRELFSELEAFLQRLLHPVDVQEELRAQEKKWARMLEEQQRKTEEQQRKTEEQQRKMQEQFEAMKGRQEAAQSHALVCPSCGGNFSAEDLKDGDKFVTCLSCGKTYYTDEIMKRAGLSSSSSSRSSYSDEYDEPIDRKPKEGFFKKVKRLLTTVVLASFMTSTLALMIVAFTSNDTTTGGVAIVVALLQFFALGLNTRRIPFPEGRLKTFLIRTVLSLSIPALAVIGILSGI